MLRKNLYTQNRLNSIYPLYARSGSVIFQNIFVFITLYMYAEVMCVCGKRDITLTEKGKYLFYHLKSASYYMKEEVVNP